MNAAVDNQTRETLSTDAKVRSLNRSLERAVELAHTNKALRQVGFAVGAIGALIGVMGFGVGSAALVKVLWQEPETIYVKEDADTGELRRLARPLEAVASFKDGTIRQHLRLYIDNCETYRYQVLNEATNRCQLFLAPNERLAYAKAMDQTNPDSPIARFGREGTVSVADDVTMERVATGRQGVEVWNLRFTKVLAERGKPPVCVPWTVMVTFRWRPELKMSETNRTINLGGMQIDSRTSGEDTVRRRGC